MNASTPENRFHSLDALRAFALLLGVVFHAAESFEAGHRAWAIVDSSPSVFLHLFRQASHSFRMEIFFLLSGFFARLLYRRRGWRGFAWNRCQRIFVPFVVGWIILHPVLVFLWIAGATKSGNWDLLGIPPAARLLPPWKLTIGFFAQGGMFQKFDLTHLWFLHQLMVLYLLAIPSRAALTRILPPGFVARLDGMFRRVVGSPWGLVFFTVPTIPMLLAMESWNVDTPKSSLWPHAPTTLLYGWLFLCGWFLHRQPALLTCFAPGWRRSLLIGLLLTVFTEAFWTWAWRYHLIKDHLAWVRIGYAVIYAWMMWTFVCGFLGLFVARCGGASTTWRYVADASYWIYLAHLPLVVALQILVARLPLHWSVKFPLIVTMALPLLFLSYHLLVRSTFLGRQLNGRVYPLRRP